MAMPPVVRRGGWPRLFSGVRAPSTLGTFPAGVPAGRVRQLDAVAARFLIGLTYHASRSPRDHGRAEHAGVTDLVVLRAEGPFYGRDMIAAARRASARLLVTAASTEP